MASAGLGPSLPPGATVGCLFLDAQAPGGGHGGGALPGARTGNSGGYYVTRPAMTMISDSMT